MLQHKAIPIKSLIAIVLLALAINLPGLFRTPFDVGLLGPLPFFPDERLYLFLAKLIHEQGWLAYFANPHSLDTMPLWPSILALFMHLPSPLLEMRIFSEILLALAVGGIFWLGYRLGGRWVGYGATALVLLFRPLHEFGHTILTEPLFVLFFILTVLALVVAMQERRLSLFWLAASLLLLTIFVRPVVQLLPLFLIAFMLWEGWRQQDLGYWLKRAVPFALIVVVLLGYGVRNAIVFDKPGLCNGSGAVLWLGSRPDTEGDEPPYRGKTYSAGSITKGHSHVSVEGDRLLTEAAIANIRENFPQYVWWSVKRIGRLLIGNRYYWIASPDAPLSLAINAPLTTYFRTLLVLGLKLGIVLLGLWLLVVRVRTKELAVLGVVSGYFILMHMPVLVNQRYGLPLVALLCAPAALAFGEMLKLPTEQRRRTVSVLGAIAILVFAYQVDVKLWAKRVAGFMREAPVVAVDLRRAVPTDVLIDAMDSQLLTGKPTSQDPQFLISLPAPTTIRRLSFEFHVEDPTVLQIFYAKSHEGFDEARSIRVPVSPDHNHYSIDLGIRTFIDQASILRVDPVEERLSFQFSNFQLN